MSAFQQFASNRKAHTDQFFTCPGSNRTVLLSSHIWWTDMIGYALLKLGYNVLFTQPWYLMYSTDQGFGMIDRAWDYYVHQVRTYKVGLIVGGNSTAIFRHPKSGELLHRAAGVPVVHFWWDEPRVAPPMCRRGATLRDYLTALRDERTLNVLWDADVMEELRELMGVANAIHCPLATQPELWPSRPLPLEGRAIPVCFLGNGGALPEGWREKADAQMLAAADALVEAHLADLDRPMVKAVGEVREGRGGAGDGLSADPTDEAQLSRCFAQWEMVDMLLSQRRRLDVVTALGRHLGEKLALVGKDWDKQGLRALSEHSGIPGSAAYYAQAKVSLNLFGGSVHSGMPLRPYDIAACNGLILTAYNRELPSLFEPGKECVEFRTVEQAVERVERILAAPREFDAVVEAGRARTLAEHAWEHRMQRVIGAAVERFGISW